MQHSDVLYKSTSAIGVGKFLVWTILIAFALNYLIQHYHENPTVIGIVICFVLLFAMINSFETIKVYEDRIEVKRTSLFPLFKKPRVYEFFQLTEIRAYFGLKTNYAIEVLPIGNSKYVQHFNEITFLYKSGEENKLLTGTTSKKQFLNIFNHIPDKLKIKITLEDRRIFINNMQS